MPKEKKLIWSAKGTIEELLKDSLIAQMVSSDGDILIVEFGYDKIENILPEQRFVGNTIQFFIYDNNTSAIIANAPYYWTKTDIVKAEVLAKKLYKIFNFKEE